MPTYPVTCKECGNDWEELCSVEQMENGIKCECGGDTKRNWNVVGMIGYDKNIGKYDIGLGCVVKNSAHRRKIMKENNLEAFTGHRSVKEQMKPYRDRIKKEKTEKADKKLKAIVSKNLAAIRSGD